VWEKELYQDPIDFGFASFWLSLLAQTITERIDPNSIESELKLPSTLNCKLLSV